MTESQKEAFLAIYSENRRNKAEKYLKVTRDAKNDEERNARPYVRTYKRDQIPTRADGRSLSPLGWSIHKAFTGRGREWYRKS